MHCLRILFLCSAAVCTTVWPLVSVAADNGSSRTARPESFIVEIRLNGVTTSSDFYEVIRDATGRTFVPAATIVELGEGVSTVQAGQHRLDIIPTQQSILVDLAAHQITINGKIRPLTTDDFVISDKVLLLAGTLMENAFDLSFDLSVENQRLSVSTNTPWPIDLRLARERRWGRSANTSEEKGPPAIDVRQDYALWGAPQMDVNLSLSNSRLGYSALMVGEMAYLTTEVFVSGSDENIGSHRIRAGRSDAQGGVFGINGLYDLQIGDVQPLRAPLIGTGPSGKGVTFRGSPMDRPSGFDTTLIEGDALPGWDAELMSGNSLVGFMRIGPDGRYRFDNIPLGYGMNLLRVVLHGPQGQTREALFRQNVGSEMVPVGHVYSQGYWLSSKALRGVASSPSFLTYGPPGGDLTASTAPAGSYSGLFMIDYGLSKSLTAGLLLAQVPDALARKSTYTGLRLRTSIHDFSVGVDVTGQHDPALAGSARATQLRAAGEIGRTTLTASHELYGAGFHSPRNQAGAIKALTNLRLSLPFDLSIASAKSSSPSAATGDWTFFYLSGMLDRTQSFNGDVLLAPSVQLSHSIAGVALTHQVSQNFSSSPGSNDSARSTSQASTYRLIGAHAEGNLALRGSLERDLDPTPGWRSMTLSASLRENDNIWAADLSGAPATTPGVGLSWSRDMGWAFLSSSASYASGSRVSLGLSLNFTLSGSPRTGVGMSSQYKATHGQADVRVYQLRLPGEASASITEEPLPGASLSVNQSAAPRLTDEQGNARLQGLTTSTSALLHLDQTTLSDSFLVPMQPALRFWPRAGQSIHLEVPVTESGEISGRLTLDEKQALVGVRLQVLNAAGQVHAETTSMNDGYFAFDTVYPGTWQFRLVPGQTWRRLPLQAEPLDVTLVAGELRKTDVEWRVHAAQ
ncbi:MAG: carboxypeptidase regulatory-like domain-containing protein [Comamonadaceae bacterium]|nr:MAG: carboxypeptidase regulatory-like domain-containing protein [Comamonadaceae bacterium]